MSARVSNSVAFSCMTEDDVRSMSVLSVKTRSDLSSRKFGSIGRCDTCGLFGAECPGHFGHIDLPVYVPHPIHTKHLQAIAKKTCGSCGASLSSSQCSECGGAPIAMDKQMMWMNPMWDLVGRQCFIKCLPVPPLRMRLPNNEHDAPLTSLLAKVVAACARYPKIENKLRAFTAVHSAVNDYMNSPAETGAAGLISRLKGKEGRMRQNLMGWRVNMAGRAVASPNPLLAPWKVCVPKIIAKKMNLKNGDTCIVNRQPSLHRSSMMAHVVQIVDTLSIQISPTVTGPYNADFDGDELNLHHVSDSKSVECRMLMGVENNMICPGVNTVAVKGVQDVVLTNFLKDEVNGSQMMKKLCKIVIKHGQNAAARFVHRNQVEAFEYLSRRGFSAGLDDFNCHVQCVSPGKMAVAETSKVIYEKLPRNNRVAAMVKAGSKGKPTNLVQLFSCIGQQTVQGKPSVPPPFAENSSSFVQSSYVQGMTESEFWHHATAAREGMIETAIKTAKCGYTMRKMVKCMENLMVQADNSVRSISTGNVVQFVYGEDASNPAKMLKTDGKYCFAAGNQFVETGDSVGILAAQSIGERLTQLTLDTFHSTGSGKDYGLSAVQNVLSAYSSDNRRCRGLVEPFLHCRILVSQFSKSVTRQCICLTQQEKDQAFLMGKPLQDRKPSCLINLDVEKLQAAGLAPWKLAANIMNSNNHCVVTYTDTSICAYNLDVHSNFITGSAWAKLGQPVVNNSVFVETNFEPDLNVYSSSAKESLSSLGVEAARQIIIQDLKNCLPNVNIRHIMLVADSMTHFGTVMPMTRTFIKNHDPHSVLAMASFETLSDVFSTSARKKIVDPVKSVSSSLSLGKMPSIGTNCFDLITTSHQKSCHANPVSDIVALLNKPSSKKRSFSQLMEGI